MPVWKFVPSIVSTKYDRDGIAMPQGYVNQCVKLQPPRHRDAFVRDRLVRVLTDGLGKKLTVVMAGAGFGKTTLAASLTLLRNDIKFIWYRVDYGDATPPLFLNYMVDAVKTASPEFGSRVSSFVGTNMATAQEIDDLADAFSLDMSACIKGETVFVLEDLHCADGCGAIWLFLTRLIECLPPNIHIMILSRTSPCLPLPVLSRRGEAVVVTENELRFTRGETEDYLSLHLGLDLTADEIGAICEYTGGWISALVLMAGLAVSMEPGKRLEFLLDIAGNPGVFDTLALRLFEGQPRDVKDFLLKTSILDDIDPGIADELLGGGKAGPILSLLERENLLTSRHGQEGVQYRYHSLLKDFLSEKLQNTYGSGDIARLKRLIGRAYAKRGEHVLALGHLLEAGAYDEAKPLLVEVLPSIMKSFKLDTAQAIFEKLPWEYISANFDLLMLHGEFLRRQGKPEEALGSFQSAVELSASMDDDKALSEALHNLAVTSFDTRLSSQVIPDVLSRLAKIDQADAVLNRLLVSACVHFSQSRFAQAYKIALEAVIGAARNEVHYPDCLSFMIAACLARGELTEAITFFGHEMACRNGRGEIKSQAEMLAIGNSVWLIALCYYALGDVEGLESLISSFGRGIDEKTAPNTVSMLNILKAFSYIIRQDYPAALDYLRNSIQYFTTAKRLNAFSFNDETSFFVRRELAHVYIIRKELGYARLCLEGNWSSDIVRQGRLEYGMLTKADMAELLICEGKYQAAKEHLDEVLNYQVRTGRVFEEFGTLALHCRTACCKGEYEDAYSYFCRALQIAVRNGYRYMCARVFDHEEFVPVLSRALRESPEAGEMIKEAFGRYNAAFLRKLLEGRTVNPHVSVERVELKPLRAEVSVKTFGGFVVETGGGKAAQWRKNKAKVLLAYMLAAEGRPLSKEYLTDVLWPEADPTGARNNLRNTLFALRKALGPPGPDDDSESVVQANREAVWVNYRESIWDVPHYEAVVQHIKEGIRRCDSGGVETYVGELKDVYRGEFLPEPIFADLFLDRRHRYREQYCWCLVGLAGLAKSAGQTELALECFKDALTVDDCLEKAHLGLMELYRDLGDRESAIRQFRYCSERLRGDLGVQPSPETVRLYETIVGEQISPYKGFGQKKRF